MTQLLTVLLFLSLSHAETRLTVRTVLAGKRVTRIESIGTAAKMITLSAARNEFEPFQIVVRAEGGAVKNINVSVSDLRSGTGAVLPRENIKLFRQYFLNVLQVHPSGGVGWKPRIEYPGPLLPFNDPYDPDHKPYGAPWNNGRIGSMGKGYKDWAGWSHRQGFAFPSGHYTGEGDKKYVVQIDTGGNAERATFRWSDSWQSGIDSAVKVKAWNATRVPIPKLGTDNRTATIPLNDGVSAWFSSHKSPHFAAGYSYHFNVYEAMNDVVWGDIYVPPDAKPGVYSGTVMVTADDHEPVRMPLQLRVWDFSIPTEKSIITAYHGWMDDRFYKDAKGTDWQFELMLHRHRMDTQGIHGQNLRGNFKFEETDWTEFDKAAAGRLDGTAYPDGVPTKMFRFGFYWPGTGLNTAQVTRFAKSVAQHLKEKGWFDRVYVYCKDEPHPQHFPGIGRDIRAFLKGDPDWRGKFMTVSSPANHTQPGGDQVDIWCFKYHWWIKPEIFKQIDERKLRRWIYVANSPYSPNPTYHLDTIKGYEARILKWAAWKLKAEGFLYWAVSLDQVLPNHWTTPLNPFGACGDANFIYYGARTGTKCGDNATPLRPINGPLPGYRIKQIREGLEDWEYLLLCEKKHGRAFTQKIVDTIYRGSYFGYGQKTTEEQRDPAWTQSEQKLYDARDQVAAAILGEEWSPHVYGQPYRIPHVEFELPELLAAGKSLELKNVRLNAKDGENLSAARLLYRTAGEQTWHSHELKPQTGQAIQVQIPASATRGEVDFYFEVKKGIQTVTEPESGARSPVHFVPDMKPPSTVPQLKIGEAKSYRVVIEWSAATDDKGIAEYRIYRGEAEGFDPEGRKLREAPPGNLTFVDPSPPGGKQTWYGVRAVDLVGREGPMAYLGVDVPADTAPLNALVVKATTGVKNCHVAWEGTIEPDVASFEISRSPEDQGAYKRVHLAAMTDRTWRDSDVEPGKAYFYRVSLIDRAGNVSKPSEPQRAKPASYARLINCGGDSFKGPDGLEWEADRAAAGGTGIYNARKPIKGAGALLPMYQTERWGSRGIVYRFDVKPGRYEVVLHFAETNRSFSIKGKRRFDIEIDGKTVAEQIDIFAAAGANTAWSKRFQVETKENKMRVILRANPGGPALKGIAVFGIE
jgi:hypothetical protein